MSIYQLAITYYLYVHVHQIYTLISVVSAEHNRSASYPAFLEALILKWEHMFGYYFIRKRKESVEHVPKLMHPLVMLLPVFMCINFIL